MRTDIGQACPQTIYLIAVRSAGTPVTVGSVGTRRWRACAGAVRAAESGPGARRCSRRRCRSRPAVAGRPRLRLGIRTIVWAASALPAWPHVCCEADAKLGTADWPDSVTAIRDANLRGHQHCWSGRCSSMAEHQLPKLNTRVRFPSSAPCDVARHPNSSEPSLGVQGFFRGRPQGTPRG